jgi:hypothetical protein
MTTPSVTGYIAPPNDHLAVEVTEAIERFAQEDDCTPLVWIMRSARYCALERLRMEADPVLNSIIAARQNPPEATT